MVAITEGRYQQNPSAYGQHARDGVSIVVRATPPLFKLDEGCHRQLPVILPCTSARNLV